MVNTPKEACPDCYDEDYEVLNYNDDELLNTYDYNKNGERVYYNDIEQWWDCRCIKCGCRFCITRTYTLTNVTVEKSE